MADSSRWEEMRLVNVWEQGDVLSCHVCLLLAPPDWQELRVAHVHLERRLSHAAMRWLFAQRLHSHVGVANVLGAGMLPEDSAFVSLRPLLALAASIDAASEVLRDVSMYPRLVRPDLAPVREVLERLHELALRDRELMPRERSGRRSTLPRRLVRLFAGFSGLMPGLVRILSVFPPGRMPAGIFVVASEVLASLIHNAKESKKGFIAAGGLDVILGFLRARPDDANIQAAGLAVLLAVSARSVVCIRRMADAGAHEDVAVALRSFPGDAKVVARATGLLANMSNVPCVCAALQRCGVLELARRLAGRGSVSSPFVGDFVQYLVSNLEEHTIPQQQ